MSTAPTGFELQRAAMAVSDTTLPEKAVLLVLAIMANADGEAWPPIIGPTGLTGKCSMSRRGVQIALRSLEAKGHIMRTNVPGRGAIYRVTLGVRTTCTCAPHAHVQDVRGGCAPRAPKQPKNNQSKNKGQARGIRLQVDWTPGPLPGNVASLVTLWPHGREDRELDQFRDFWTAKAGADACKLDWDRTWHTWIRRAHDQIMREASYGQSPASRGGQSRRASRSNEMDAAMRDLGFG